MVRQLSKINTHLGLKIMVWGERKPNSKRMWNKNESHIWLSFWNGI